MVVYSHGSVYLKSWEDIKDLVKYHGVDGMPVVLYNDHDDCVLKTLGKHLEEMANFFKNDDEELPYIVRFDSEPIDYKDAFPLYDLVDFKLHWKVWWVLKSKYGKEIEECEKEMEAKRKGLSKHFGDILKEITTIDDNVIIRRESWPETKKVIFMRWRRPNIRPGTPYAAATKGKVLIHSRFDLIDDRQVFIGWQPSIEDMLAWDWVIEHQNED